MKRVKYADRQLVLKAKKYGIKCHKEANHKYDENSYRYHLAMVHEYFVKYTYLIENHEDFYHAEASTWTHDTIKYARQTLDDVVKACGEKVGEISYAISNEKGRNKDQRENAKYYEEMRLIPLAPFVKICDRLANAWYSSIKKGTMYEEYQKEAEHFKAELYDEKYAKMFKELDEILNTISHE